MHDQHGAEDFPQQNADEGTHFDDAIAAHQFIRRQLLWQVGVFDRAEQGRVNTHADDRQYEQRQAVQHPAGAGNHHDGNFQQLDAARHARLFKLVSKLAGGGR